MAPGKNSVNPELDEIISRPENRFCADCGAKAPRWASVNLGLLMCIDCSGAHRNLGTHVSVVKSVTLDKWQPKWISTVSKIGNEIANRYFEAKMREGDRPRDGDREKLSGFIRAKYERKEWAPRGQLQPNELLAQGRNPDDFSSSKGRDDRDRDDDDRRRRDDRDDRRRREPSPEASPPPARRSQANASAPAGRAPPQAAPKPKPAPSVDLLGGFDPAPQPQQSMPPPQMQQQPQQQPQIQQVGGVASQLGGLSFGGAPQAPAAAPMPDLFAQQMPAQQAQAMPQQLQQPQASEQDQKLDYMKNALSSLYQQPPQQKESPYAVLSNLGVSPPANAAPGSYSNMGAASMPAAAAYGGGYGMSGGFYGGAANPPNNGGGFMQPGAAPTGAFGQQAHMGSGAPQSMPQGYGMQGLPTMQQQHQQPPPQPQQQSQQQVQPHQHQAFAGLGVLPGSTASSGLVNSNFSLSGPGSGGAAPTQATNTAPSSSPVAGSSFGDIDAFSMFGKAAPNQAPQQQASPAQPSAGPMGSPGQQPSMQQPGGGMMPGAGYGMPQMQGGMMQQPGMQMGGMQQMMGMQGVQPGFQQSTMQQMAGMQQVAGMQQSVQGMSAMMSQSVQQAAGMTHVPVF